MGPVSLDVVIDGTVPTGTDHRSVLIYLEICAGSLLGKLFFKKKKNTELGQLFLPTETLWSMDKT